MDNEFRIAEILKERRITQTDLADRIGISRVGLSKAINGNTTIATLRKIATALDVSVSELFEKKKVISWHLFVVRGKPTPSTMKRP